MIDIAVDLTKSEKAGYFDFIVGALLKWNNCPLDDLRVDRKSSRGFKYNSRQDAFGYEVFSKLMDDGVVRRCGDAGQIRLELKKEGKRS